MPTLPLRDMPQDVRTYIHKLQKEVRDKKGVKQYSLNQIIYQIIREHKATCCDESNESSPSVLISQMKMKLERLEECFNR